MCGVNSEQLSMTNPRLQDILHKEVTRKEFLSILGLNLIVILGFDRLLTVLTTHESGHKNMQMKGYGSGSYGAKSEA